MKQKLSIIFNTLVIIFGLIGFILTYNNNHRLCLEYFTEESNLLALVVASIYLYFSINKKKIPEWLSTLKFIVAVCLTLTFLVVIFVLAPMFNFNYYYFLFYGSMLFHHFLCPILFVLTFIAFDKIKLEKKVVKIGCLPVLIYALIFIILNILKIVDGPYPFLRVYNQPLFMSLFWIIIIFGLTYGICLMLYKMCRR